MKIGYYCVKDDLVGFGNLFTAFSDAVASRDFRIVCNDPDSKLGTSPSDFSLYRVGEFDTESGEFVSGLEFIERGISV